MIHKTLTHAAAAAALLCSATGAMANSYVLSGDLTYADYYSGHPNTGTFHLKIETAAPLSGSFTTITAISGTYLGQTVTGLSSWYDVDQKVRDSSSPFTANGIGFTFEPLPTGYFAGNRDNVANIYALGNSIYSWIGTTAIAYDYSSEYNVSNFTVSAVPEPGTYAMMGLGLLGLTAVARRRQRAR